MINWDTDGLLIPGNIVKDSLTQCAKGDCSGCRYRMYKQTCQQDMLDDALKYIKELETENRVLENSIRHLLESEYIRKFYKRKLNTSEYKLDIKEADAYIKRLEKLRDAVVTAVEEYRRRGE